MGLFGIFSQKDSVEKIKEYLDKGAVVLDVRTQEEWDEGHIDGATHIVLNTIPHKLRRKLNLYKNQLLLFVEVEEEVKTLRIS